jgi:excisionase family DNA binding protein
LSLFLPALLFFLPVLPAKRNALNYPIPLQNKLKKTFYMEVNFDTLPKAVAQLFDKLENIERLLLSKSNDAQPEEDKLLKIQEAAEILHLSVPTVYDLVHKSKVPVCKRGNRLYFSKKELTAWIMSGRKKTTSEISADADNYLRLSGKSTRG